MNQTDFVHLHVHTQFSLLDGACRINQLMAKAAEYNMKSLAMTDHGNMFGAVNFYQAALKHNIQPILGIEGYLLGKGSRLERSVEMKKDLTHIILLAKNMEGYKNLLKLSSAAYMDGFYYHPRMDKELLAKHSEGIICSSACLRGEIAQHLMKDDYKKARAAADEYRQMFAPGDYYIELMDHGIPIQKTVNEGLIRVAKDLNLPMIATNDVHYLDQEQSYAHDALLCIQTQATLDDPRRMRLHNDQFYFKSQAEMQKRFSWEPTLLSNTLEVAEKCQVQFDFDKFHLPRFTTPDGKSKEVYLRELCEQALPGRYAQVTEEIRKRLDHELATIERMGFVAYFLIVWDFINYAKQQDIPVGPGRGSAAGSMVSYLLGITNLDPLQYDLLFERFLNPDRAGMPDIDIDFCYERRGEVIEYVTRKYGRENVAQIITFGTMQAKAAIRDVGRVLDMPYSEVDKIAKLVPNELGITLKDALDKEDRLRDLCEKDRRAGDIMKIAQALEGLNRHASIHAAGVVIADRPLDEYVPLYKTSDDQVVTGFTMDGIAKMGLLKMDFLGLRTLTVIHGALRLIEEKQGLKIDVDDISLHDQKTYELLSQANSFGVFQLESAGMRELLKKIRPSDFEDIIAILALYRPGPMGSGMLDDYIKRKRGDSEVVYDHPKLEAILKETYGIILYQEQVMKIPVVLANFSLVQADHLRRAMSKKIAKVMEQMRIDFVEGCQSHSGMTKDKANYIFDLIDYFSGYGFNKSHSAAYALISYQTAYLKANYPVEFMCALLNSECHNTDKVVEYIKEVHNMGIKVIPPNVHKCQKLFSAPEADTIAYGLLAVKNVGSGAIDSILEKRKDGPYRSLFNFCERVDLRLVNRKVIESMIKSGAMDDFKLFRSQLMAILERALEHGVRTQKEKASGQYSLFDMMGDGSDLMGQMEKVPQIKEWSSHQLLAYEKESMGLYVSGHPLAHYEVEIQEFTDHHSGNLSGLADGYDVRLVGMVSYVKLTNTRKTGERMAIIRLEDVHGEIEAVLFPSVYAEFAPMIQSGEVLFLRGKVNRRDDNVSLIVNDLQKMQNIYESIKGVHIDLTKSSKQCYEDLKILMTHHQGKTPVYLKLKTKANKSVEIRVGEELFVDPNIALFNEIKANVGSDKIHVKF